MTTYQDSFINPATLAAHIEETAAGHPRVFVGIDGPSASGKSTLAKLLTAEIDSAYLVHADDFYLPSSRRDERLGRAGALYDLPRLAAQVIKLGSSGERMRYQRYDWTLDEFAEWIEIPKGAPVIVEGVYCLATELQAAYTYKIWCTVDPQLRLARGLLRDGEEAQSMWTDVWMPTEDDYAAKQRPDLAVDLIVDSTAVDDDAITFRAIGGRSISLFR